MIKQRKVSPEMKRADWNAVGGLTILFSGFVAFWDWMHTHDEGASEMELKPRGSPRTRELEPDRVPIRETRRRIKRPASDYSSYP